MISRLEVRFFDFRKSSDSLIALNVASSVSEQASRRHCYLESEQNFQIKFLLLRCLCLPDCIFSWAAVVVVCPMGPRPLSRHGPFASPRSRSFRSPSDPLFDVPLQCIFYNRNPRKCPHCPPAAESSSYFPRSPADAPRLESLLRFSPNGLRTERPSLALDEAKTNQAQWSKFLDRFRFLHSVFSSLKLERIQGLLLDGNYHCFDRGCCAVHCGAFRSIIGRTEFPQSNENYRDLFAHHQSSVGVGDRATSGGQGFHRLPPPRRVYADRPRKAKPIVIESG